MIIDSLIWLKFIRDEKYFEWIVNVVEFGKVLKQEIAALFNVEIFKSISRGGGGILENTFWEKAIVFKKYPRLHKSTLSPKANNLITIA